MSDESQPPVLGGTISDYIQDMRSEKARCTVQCQEYRLRSFSRWFTDQELESLNEITEDDLQDYEKWCREENQLVGELAPNAVKARLFVLQQFLRFCGDENLVPDDLYIEVPLPDASTNGEDR